ncbi:MAG: hypothetical protein V7L26_04310 [Nostoc sp.]|uniref:hypothetical protein n=1 Tax=Nostoc sp. TaxID=1180 RepID=UPI002FEFEC47
MPNYQELYAGKVDLVARYQGVPHLIEWTTAEEPKKCDRLPRSEVIALFYKHNTKI